MPEKNKGTRSKGRPEEPLVIRDPEDALDKLLKPKPPKGPKKKGSGKG